MDTSYSTGIILKGHAQSLRIMHNIFTGSLIADVLLNNNTLTNKRRMR